MRVLVREDNYSRYGATVREAFPDVDFVLLDNERRLLDVDGRPIHVTDFEVAWGSQGIFLDDCAGSFVDRLAASKTLRWFQSSGAGNDKPIIKHLLERGVYVTATHVHSISIAESVMRGVLDRFQDAEAWRSAQRRGEWSPHWFTEVHGTRWLIFGVGAIGADVAIRARAFGAHVIGVRRTPSGYEPVDEMIGPEAVLARLPECDVVVLAAPGNATTRNVVDAEFLARVKRGAILVNPSRGSLIDETALLAALDAGAVGAAILDSFVDEPLPSGHPFWTHPLVDVTPHSTARGSGRAERSAFFFLENLRRFRADEPLLDSISAPVAD